MVELMNLYVKVCLTPYAAIYKADVPSKVFYAGSGPNKTIEHIVDQSGIIEIFHTTKEVATNNYWQTSRTVNHANPNIESTIAYIQKKLH